MKPACPPPPRKRVHMVRRVTHVGGVGDVYEFPVSLPAAPWEDDEASPHASATPLQPPRRKPGGRT